MLDKTILFSVIIPTHNRAKLLQQAIQSVLDQSCPDWELIIVDDGSLDNTKAIVNSFENSRIHYFFQENKERSAARNLGILKAKGEYICFMDDDDYFLETHLQNFHVYLTQNNFPKTILRIGYYKEHDDGKRIETINFNSDVYKNPVYYAAYNMCGVWSLCVPSIFLNSEKFPNAFPHWQDTHLILRLLAKHPFHQLENYTYVYRIHKAMGSIKLFTKDDFKNRMNLNIQAIQDLFEKYNHLVEKYLPQKTKEYLVAEKLLQYSIRAIKVLSRGESFIIFKQSVLMNVSSKNWKYYLIYIYTFLKF